MAKKMNSNDLIPVICIDESANTGAELFDPNAWPTSESKGVIYSTWSEYSVLYYCVRQLIALCKNSEQHVKKHINTIKGQWATKKFDLSKTIIYGQYPDLHIQIEAFFSGVKSILDLLVQLLSTERIVNGKIDGFHREKDNYGGRVLNMLKNNASNSKKDAANKFHALISEHKKCWIDQTISARDQLVHPEQGMHQLMFHLKFVEKQNELECASVNSPTINSESIDQYSKKTLDHVTKFTSSFIDLLKNENPNEID